MNYQILVYCNLTDLSSCKMFTTTIICVTTNDKYYKQICLNGYTFINIRKISY